MKKLDGLKIALCQMVVVPGRPDTNAEYIIREIREAANRGIDIIAFPEMCVPGYIIGDKWEDDAFILDVLSFNEKLREATSIGITVIFGSIYSSLDSNGEDGRLRKCNAAFIAQDGKWVGCNIKMLQPNYRIFDDDRHYFSKRKLREEMILQGGSVKIGSYCQPFDIKIGSRQMNAGVILCEDMWKDGYLYNPTKEYVMNGAEVIFNLSASPWSWQKNRKRHQIVRDLLTECKVPFVYVNNTGIQNNGKNIVVFDGSSTVYDESGNIIFQIPAYETGSRDIIFSEHMPAIEADRQDDTTELYLAIRCAVKYFFDTLPSSMRKVCIGLSGGIDSALDATLLVDILGRENVFTYNMPSRYSSLQTMNLARQIANNLGIALETIPIQKVVDAIAQTSGCEAGTLEYENIQARARMEILAAKAQKIGGVFVGNCNKVEIAFGYGTLYGDIAGLILPIGDLVKREVYQLANYINQAVFESDIIPNECFEIAPTAELNANQRDPFDYGNLHRRGYHDEMLRAFVEFRKNPEWLLDLYIQGKLEDELKLEAGTLKRLFSTDIDFIKDLERCWRMFHFSVFKRVQAPPIPIVSKRAFGYDLRESILWSYQTVRYKELKEHLLSGEKKIMRIALYGGSFNPSHKAHRKVAEKLEEIFDQVVIVPCGLRPEKDSANLINPVHRKQMALLNFSGMSKVQFDFHDAERGTFTPNYYLQERYEELYPDAEIWHVVGTDIILSGEKNQSEIHRTWKYGSIIWQSLNWAVIYRPGCDVTQRDMPPHSIGPIVIEGIIGSGTMIRNRIAKDEPFDDLVIPEVAKYIKEKNIYEVLCKE